MSSSTPVASGPWRYLLFDGSDPADPKWVLLSVTVPSDVRPADRDDRDRAITDWRAVTGWLRATVGRAVTLVPLDPDRAQLWHVREG